MTKLNAFAHNGQSLSTNGAANGAEHPHARDGYSNGASDFTTVAATPTGTGAQTFEFSRFNSKRDNSPKTERLDWRGLCAMLEHRRDTATDTDAAKDGAAIGGAFYPPQVWRRADKPKELTKENGDPFRWNDADNPTPEDWRAPIRDNGLVTAVSLAILDFDNGTTLEEIKVGVARLNSGKGAAAFIYSTFSHTPETPKFRVVLPLLAPVVASDWPDVWKRLALAFDGAPDVAAKDAARLHFLPSCPRSRAGDAVAVEIGGAPLDVATLLQLPKPAPVEQPRRPVAQIGANSGDRYAEKAVANELERLRETSSHRNKALNTAALAIGHFVGAGRWNRSDAESALLDACYANGYTKKDGESATRATMRSGLDAGEREPNYDGLTPERGARPSAGAVQPRHAQSLDGSNPATGNEASPDPGEDDWREPLPLKNALYPVSPLPDVLIPAPLRDWVFDCAQRVSVAPDYIAVAALVSLASLIGNTVLIRPKKYDDWSVTPNLWGVAVGSPSVKKSPAIAEALKPLSRLRASAIEEHKDALKDWEANDLLGDINKDALKGELKKAKARGASNEELRAMIDNAEEENQKPQLKTYSVQDATIEALTGVLERTPRGLLIQRDELAGWLRAMDKQGHEQDRAYFLEAFGGGETNIQIERVGRGTVILPHCTLSILGTIQPRPFAALIRAASADGGADGFVARFQLLVYPDPVPYVHVDRWPNVEAKNRAFAIFEALDKLTPEWAGAEIEEGEKPYLRFDAEAQTIFDDWITTLETRLETLGDLIGQHLAKYRSLMPSLSILFHLIAIADGSAQPGPISVDAAEMAAAWCEFLEEHARRIYGMAGDGATDGAELIASRLGQLPNPFRSRDVHQKKWAGLAQMHDVESALARMEDRGWLRSQPEETGGRPTERFWKHPAKAGEK